LTIGIVVPLMESEPTKFSPETLVALSKLFEAAQASGTTIVTIPDGADGWTIYTTTENLVEISELWARGHYHGNGGQNPLLDKAAFAHDLKVAAEAATRPAEESGLW